MQLNGTFEGFDFAHLLQMLASTGKSGRLRLESDQNEKSLPSYQSQGLVLLRDGKIICAVSTSVRESLGSILLSRGWLTAKQLEAGLKLQQESLEERRLGAVLVSLGFVEQQQLESAVAEQVAQVISEFLRWRTGTFGFDEVRFPDRGEVELATGTLPLDRGLAADQILLGITAGQVETLHMVPPPTVEVPSLPEVVRDFPAPLVTGEVGQRILDLARGVVGRGALFQVGPSEFLGMTQFGMGGDGVVAPDFIRNLRLNHRLDSILRDVLNGRSQYQGVLDPSPGNEILVDLLGGSWPTEIFAGPLFAAGKVMLVFYGDNLPTCGALGDTFDLSAQLLRSGSMLEHCLLSRTA